MMRNLNVFGSFVRVAEDCTETMHVSCKQLDSTCVEVSVTLSFDGIIFNPVFRYKHETEVDDYLIQITEEQSFDICDKCMKQLRDKQVITNRFLYRTVIAVMDVEDVDYLHETNVIVQ
jgi:hypothetical protein